MLKLKVFSCILKDYYFLIIIFYSVMAHYFALNLVMKLIPYTTIKHQTQSSPIQTQQICFSYTSRYFDSLIAKLFLDDIKYDESSKSNIEKSVELLKNSFGKLIDENDWMDPATKKLAKEKLVAIQAYVGAPDFYLNEKKLEKEFAEVSYQLYINLIKFGLFNVLSFLVW